MRVKNRYLGPLVLLLTIGVLATAALSDYFHERITAETASLVTAGDTPETRTLSVHSWYRPSTLYKGDTLQLDLRLKNVSGGLLTNIEFVEFRIPRSGFQPLGPCWTGGVPSCRRVPTGWMVDPRLFPLSLRAGDAITVGGPLPPVGGVAGLGSYVIAGVVRWNGGDNTESVRPIRVGPIQVRSWPIDVLILVGGAVKTLALPIILAILGIYFQRHQANRSMVLETWNQMLPKSHALAETHYLPISLWSERLHGELLGHRDRHDGLDGCRKCFFYGVMFLRGMKKLRQDVGGFYFKNRSGERLVSDAWNLVNGAMELALTRGLKDALLDEVDGTESYATFERKFLGPAEGTFNSAETSFRKWCSSGGAAGYLGVLRAFYGILDCEMNRPYEFWYGESETLSEKQCVAITEELRTAEVVIPEDFKIEVSRYLCQNGTLPRKERFKKEKQAAGGGQLPPGGPVSDA